MILPTVALSGCAVQPDSWLASGVRQCVSAAAISGRYGVPPNSIMFEMTGPVNFRNTLRRSCPGLDRLGQSATIVFENSTGGQICSGDRVRPFDARDMGPNRLVGSPVCDLGRFVSVSRDLSDVVTPNSPDP